MRKSKSYIAAFVSLLLFILWQPNALFTVKAAELPEVQSQNAILIDANSGQMLYGKNENDKAYPASTTKMMVALLALENLELDEVVTASASAISLLKPGYTNMGILADEELTVRQLLYGLLLASAGDAANVLGERISGSVDSFVKLMNMRALELGMTNTNFTNTSGEQDENHYTTAADLALLATEVMKNQTFREIVATDLYIIPATNKYTEERRLSSTNHLVSSRKTSKYYYSYATGIKTGFTNAAKLCLAASAEKNGVSLICVVLGADTVDGEMMDFVDAKNLFEYGFANYEQRMVVEGGTIVAQAKIKSAKGARQVLLEAKDSITFLAGINDPDAMVEHTDTINENIKAPISKGDVLGTAEYFVDSVSVGTVELVADKDYAFDPVKNVLGVFAAIFTSPFLYLSFVLIVLVLFCIRQYNYRKRRRARMAAKRAQQKREAAERRGRLDDMMSGQSGRTDPDKYFEDLMK